MIMRKLCATFLALLLVAVMPFSAMAQQTFQPVVANFNGDGALIMPANESLDINGSGTVEFWVSAKWGAELDYDPAIMAYSGEGGVRFSFHLAGDKSGLGVFAGESYDGVGFDFSDGLLHHVAIMSVGDTIDIYIDGMYQDTLGFGFGEFPADNFSIGAIGEFSPFIGEIGQVRIWSVPLDIEVLRYFSLRPLQTNEQYPHPDLEFLTGLSAFANPEMGGFVFIGDVDMPNMTNEPD